MRATLKHAVKGALVVLLMTAGHAGAATAQDNELSVTAPQVQQYLDTAFPREFDALGGMFTLTARDPTLTIPESGQRLQLAFSASASSAGREDTPVGRIHMSSGLRYDSQAHALYLDQPALDDVQPAASSQRIDEQTRLLLNLWLSDYARREPLYRLDPDMVAQLGTLNVESTRIEGGRIIVQFNQPVAMPDLGNGAD
jgi:hypothetical protein